MRKSKNNTNNKVDKAERRLKLKCSICLPNKGENAKRKPVHGNQKPTYKN